MNKKEVYGGLLSCITAVAGIDNAKKFDTLFRDHKKLNLKNPQTLSDKVSYIELHEQSPLAASCTDKYAVREYVTNKGLGDILVPIYGGGYTRFEDINLTELPDSFAIKATHGCKMNYLVPEKEKLDKNKCVAEMSKWLKTTYGTYSMEPHYLEIPHRIYAEEYLADADKLIDYKFHCMNGVPQFVLVCGDRVVTEMGNSISRHIFDMNWKPLVGLTDETSDKIERPEHLEQMIDIAKKLSADFKFVRVDLYDINGKVYFGELTFSPTNGVFSHYTQEFLNEMGNKLQI